MQVTIPGYIVRLILVLSFFLGLWPLVIWLMLSLYGVPVTFWQIELSMDALYMLAVTYVLIGWLAGLFIVRPSTEPAEEQGTVTETMQETVQRLKAQGAITTR